MSKKYLHGNLNLDYISPHYEGLTSDSVIITVDNSNKTIKGDVIWDDAIGELAHKAYPGDKGARNYNLIVELTKKLDNEIEDAVYHRKSLNSAISILEDYVSKTVNELSAAVEKEIDRSSSVDVKLEAALQTELQRALQAEEELLQKLNAEVSSLKVADNSLQSKLNLIVTELSSQIEVISTTLNQELSNLSNSNGNLQSLVATETERAKKAEENIQSTLDSEISRFQDITTNLDTKLEEINESLSFQEDYITSIRGLHSNDVSELKATDAHHDELLLDHEIMLMRHSKDINVHGTTINNLVSTTNALAEYVDQVEDSLEEEIESRKRSNNTLQQLIQLEINRSTSEDNYLRDELRLQGNYIRSAHDKIESTLTTSTESIQELEKAVELLSSENDTLSTSLKTNLLQLQQKDTEQDRVLELEKTLREQSIQSIESDIQVLRSLTNHKLDRINVEESNIEKVYTQSSNGSFLTQLESTSIPSSIVKRDADGNILITTTEIKNSKAAISKEYVDNLAESLKDSVLEYISENLVYDFIDGGNAPI